VFLDRISRRVRELTRRAGLGRVPTPVLVAALALLSVAVVAGLIRCWPQPSGGFAVESAARRTPVRASAGGSSEDASSAGRSSSASSSVVVVDVAGAVRHPGVYSLPVGARVESAVDAAGGPTADAQLSAVNQAALLTDAEQILVPQKGEESGASSVGAASSGASGGAPVAGAGATGKKVNLNTADATELDTLPGVGPATAAKIVSDRATNGPFKSVDDLARVPGIGPKKLEQLRASVCVR
jgi:competence protein ComEA